MVVPYPHCPLGPRLPQLVFEVNGEETGWLLVHTRPAAFRGTRPALSHLAKGEEDFDGFLQRRSRTRCKALATPV